MNRRALDLVWRGAVLLLLAWIGYSLHELAGPGINVNVHGQVDTTPRR